MELVSAFESGLLSPSSFRGGLVRWAQRWHSSVQCDDFQRLYKLFAQGILSEDDMASNLQGWALRAPLARNSKQEQRPGPPSHVASATLSVSKRSENTVSASSGTTKKKDLTMFFKPVAKETTFKFRCEFCGASFGNEGALGSHQRCRHTVEVATRMEQNRKAFQQMLTSSATAAGEKSAMVIFPSVERVATSESKSPPVVPRSAEEKQALHKLACKGNRGSERRTRLSVGQKATFIKEVETLIGRTWKEAAAKREVSLRRAIPLSTLNSMWLKRKEIQDAAARNKKAKLVSCHKRGAKYMNMETELFKRFKHARALGRQISARWFRVVGKQILDEQQPDNSFSFSHGWLTRFFARHNLSLRRATNAKVQVVGVAVDFLVDFIGPHACMFSSSSPASTGRSVSAFSCEPSEHSFKEDRRDRAAGGALLQNGDSTWIKFLCKRNMQRRALSV